jgi:hypothetical protein
MRSNRVSGNGGIVPPYIQDNIAAGQIKGALVEANKKGKIGSRTLQFKVAGKNVQTDEAVKALINGKSVRGTVMTFKTMRGDKVVGGPSFRTKVRVPGVNIQTFKSVAEFNRFTTAQVLAFNNKL